MVRGIEIDVPHSFPIRKLLNTGTRQHVHAWELLTDLVCGDGKVRVNEE